MCSLRSGPRCDALLTRNASSTMSSDRLPDVCFSNRPKSISLMHSSQELRMYRTAFSPNKLGSPHISRTSVTTSHAPVERALQITIPLLPEGSRVRKASSWFSGRLSRHSLIIITLEEPKQFSFDVSTGFRASSSAVVAKVTCCRFAFMPMYRSSQSRKIDFNQLELYLAVQCSQHEY